MRYTIPGDLISIAYGDQELGGPKSVFLSVTDKRLEWNDKNTKQVNKVTESIGIQDGSGSYLNLYTGQYGIGVKVDDQTMVVFLKRFGVTDDQISNLPLKIPFNDATPKSKQKRVGSSRVCNFCKTKNTTCQDCMKCKSVHYCSKDCQRSDWKIHKLFCGLRCDDLSTKDSTSSTMDTVKAFLLPEGSDSPTMIHLPLKNITSSEGRYEKLYFNGFIDGFTNRIRSDLFTDSSIRNLPHAYHLIFKDDVSESQENQCILRLFQITAKKQGAKSKKYPVVKSHWKDNVIIVKAIPSTTADPGKYQDISIADATEAVKFLYKYTGSHGLL